MKGGCAQVMNQYLVAGEPQMVLTAVCWATLDALSSMTQYIANVIQLTASLYLAVLAAAVPARIIITEILTH
jgi:hypothetical protein